MVNSPAAGYQYGSGTGRDVAALTTGDFAAIWVTGFPKEDIYAQLFDSSGNKLGGEFRVDSFGTEPRQQGVHALPGGGFVVVFEAYPTHIANSELAKFYER